MLKIATAALAAGFAVLVASPAAALDDAQIAHIAVTADSVEIAWAQLALQKSTDARVRQFAQAMVQDETALNTLAASTFRRLNLAPKPNGTSNYLEGAADKTSRKYASLSGADFDRSYVKNEVSFHKKVNSALEGHLIPDARSPQLKDLLQIGLAKYQIHELQAEKLAAQLG